MNWLLIIIAGVLLLCVLHGYRKGFLRILFSLVSLALSIAFVAIATPYICDFLENHTKLQAAIEEKCISHMEASADKTMEETLSDKEQSFQDAGIALPDGIWEKILGQGIGTANTALKESGLYESIAETVAHFVINGIAFFLALLIASVFVFIIGRMLGVVGRMPVIRDVNHVLGGITGFVQGMIIIWLILYLIAVGCTSSLGQTAIACIGQSKILTWLYNNNPLLYLIMIYFG